MNFVENFNALFDQSFFVFLDTKLFKQALPSGAHGMLTVLCLYLPKVQCVTNMRGSASLGKILFVANFSLRPQPRADHNRYEGVMCRRIMYCGFGRILGVPMLDD